MFEDAQMIVAGGDDGGSYCNKSYPPFKVLDTSTYIWQTDFEPNHKPYTVPLVVRKVVGGG